MGKLLPKSFYTRNDVIQVSKDLLGKKLVSTLGGVKTSGMIVETEAYRAPDDKASHAYGNHLTNRTKTMFEEGGVAYVYICYGIHHLFNVVSGEEGNAHVVLIRGLEPIEGLEHMSDRRKMKSNNTQLCNGPGKFTRAMAITKAQDKLSLLHRQSKLWIEDFQTCPEEDILEGPRVGMATAEECSNWPFRFRVKNNPWTSKPDHVWYDLK